MTKFLLTGGSGFIAAHILEQLLEAGHTVVTTVRSEPKAAPIRKAHANDISSGKLEVFIVPDINAPGAFDNVVKSPNIELVLHTASPFHYKFSDPQTELLDPAINGTTSILRAVTASCPTVKRVVITSSFASIINDTYITDPNFTFSEKDWNPITPDQIYTSKANAYRASKTFAEMSAWKFVEEEKPGWDLATICPPLVFGPLAHHIDSLLEVNTSNERIVGLAEGHWKENGIPPTAVYFWVDVRDVAKAHIQATLVSEAGGKRFLVTAGYFCHDDMVEAVGKEFPSLKEKLPQVGTENGVLPPADKICKVDNERATKVLGIDWIGIGKSTVDTVKSLDKVDKLI
ncbi:hypothetical protein MKZ38_001119 [Zalerion maritima]|uniref:NAD-dependent epimerase/dehydratase domain-containing protein n=1 Tax=Zalerion maritima TaxID=339359 RepID=A0AAD5WS54_9PEZI|nr:hypothetical protein MKZ38_001119 [Zalerion maritima]